MLALGLPLSTDVLSSLLRATASQLTVQKCLLCVAHCTHCNRDGRMSPVRPDLGQPTMSSTSHARGVWGAGRARGRLASSPTFRLRTLDSDLITGRHGRPPGAISSSLGPHRHTPQTLSWASGRAAGSGHLTSRPSRENGAQDGQPPNPQLRIKGKANCHLPWSCGAILQVPPLGALETDLVRDPRIFFS